MNDRDEELARILSQETNYAYSAFCDRLKEHVITNLTQAIRNDPSKGNAALIVSSAIKSTLEDQASRELAADLERFGIET